LGRVLCYNYCIDVGPSYELTLKNNINYNNMVRTQFLDAT